MLRGKDELMAKLKAGRLAGMCVPPSFPLPRAASHLHPSSVPPIVF